VVLNDTAYRNDLSPEENSRRSDELTPNIVLLGGDDYEKSNGKDIFVVGDENKGGGVERNDLGGGRLRNDVWMSSPSVGQQAGWNISSVFWNHDPDAIDPSVITSDMRWWLVNPGYTPPAVWAGKEGDALTYDDWISCQDYFVTSDNFQCRDPDPECFEDITSPEKNCHPPAVWKRHNMWSERRGHGSIVANERIYVIGGRAREYTRMFVKGKNRRVETVRDHSSVREEIVLKNDVWVSGDGGREWRLVTPGCRDPQRDVLLRSEVWSSVDGREESVGREGAKCIVDEDCYGAAVCQDLYGLKDDHEKVCLCPMFSPREHHGVVVQHSYYNDHADGGEKGVTFSEDYIYVVGGFTNVRQSFCADHSCGMSRSGGYRLALDDVWVSNDGLNWVQLKPAFSGSWKGRGSHATLLVHANYFNKTINTHESARDQLYVLGGETSDPAVEEVEYLNDVWYVNLPSAPCCRIRNNCYEIHHPLLPEDAKACFLGDEWVNISTPLWKGRSGHTAAHEPASSRNGFREQIYIIGGQDGENLLNDVWTWGMEKEWRMDFTPQQWFRIFNNGKIEFGVNKDKPSPHFYYRTEEDAVETLERVRLPFPEEATTYSRSSLLSADSLEILHSLRIYTIKDLAEADLFTILKLRGYDHPWEDVRTVPNTCYLRALARDFVHKCQLRTDDQIASGKTERPHDTHSCHDGKCYETDWDGCTPIEGYLSVDVHTLGNVAVPQDYFDTLRDLEEMQCRQTLPPRHHSAAVFIDDKLLLFGGSGTNQKYNNNTNYQDVWSRDDSFPRAMITRRPESDTHDSLFSFQSDEAGASLFQYKIVDAEERRDVTPWIVTTEHHGANVNYLDDKKGGPGKGIYILYVRAIDPSGNIYFGFSDDSIHMWRYIPPPPWGAILGYSSLLLLVGLGGYWEYRRRSRRAALERYAVRRMRRKFKLREGGGDNDNDWRVYYAKKKKQDEKTRKDKARERRSREDPEGKKRKKKDKKKRSDKDLKRRKRREEEEEDKRRRERKEKRARRKEKARERKKNM